MRLRPLLTGAGLSLSTAIDCPLAEQPIVTLVWNNETREYLVYNETEDAGLRMLGSGAPFDRTSGYLATKDSLFDSLNDSRHLRAEPWLEDSLPAIALDRQLQRVRWEPAYDEFLESDDRPIIVRVRECPCRYKIYGEENPFTYYFELHHTHCWVNRRGSPVQPTCLIDNHVRNMTKNIWPVVAVWYAILLGCLLCTVPGRSACDCLVSHVFPCWNSVVIRIMARRNPERIHLLMHRFYLRNRERIEQRYREAMTQRSGDEQRRRPTRLHLKTRVYTEAEAAVAAGEHASTTTAVAVVEDDELVDGHVCSICYMDLVAGDRVGDMPCKHLIHADCLKSWLPRRNVCPLCLQTDVAAPQYEETTGRSEPAEEEPA